MPSMLFGSETKSWKTPLALTIRRAEARWLLVRHVESNRARRNEVLRDVAGGLVRVRARLHMLVGRDVAALPCPHLGGSWGGQELHERARRRRVVEHHCNVTAGHDRGAASVHRR